MTRLSRANPLCSARALTCREESWIVAILKAFFIGLIAMAVFIVVRLVARRSGRGHPMPPSRPTAPLPPINQQPLLDLRALLVNALELARAGMSLKVFVSSLPLIVVG